MERKESWVLASLFLFVFFSFSFFKSDMVRNTVSMGTNAEVCVVL